MRIRILDRYVLSEFLRLFLLFAAAAPVLFILGDVTDNLDRHLNRGYTAVQILLNYVYQVPLFVLYSFPIASLIASVFTVNSMTRYSEVTAAKAGGVSFYRLYAPLPILGVVLTVAGLGISELVPIAERARVAALEESANRGRTSRTDFVYRTADGWVLSVRRLDAGRGTMTRVVAEREGNEPEIPSIYIHAQEAVYSAETGWVLRNGIYRSMFGPEVERAFRFYELRMPGLTETPEQLLAEPRAPEEMGYAELGRFIEIIERSGGRPLELKVERAQKIAIPVATLVIILFAVPLSTSSQRGGSAYGVGISLAITIVYLMLFRVAGAAGASGALPPTLAAWIPNGAFAAAALVLAARVRT
ncbi:MAG: LptF/LptG family permease [Gemmatimonadota bacterium]|jgi:lipopolysaccharide export system permease protein